MSLRAADGLSVHQVVALAPQLLRQEPGECVPSRAAPLDATRVRDASSVRSVRRTRALLERVRAHFASADAVKIVSRRPQLLLRSASALLDEWQRAPQRKKRAQAKPSVVAASGDSGAAASSLRLDATMQVADSSASSEASAAARNAMAEILAAGRPMPRYMSRRGCIVCP